MDPATLLLAGASFLLLHERLVARRERLERRVDLVEGGEQVEAIRAAAQLARRLRTAQEQQGQERPLAVVDRQHLIEHLAELGHPRPVARVDDAGEAGGPEAIEGGLDLVLLEGDDGVATGGLVAGGAQAVERHRIGVGDGALLLEEAPDHPLLDGVELQRHGGGA